MIREALYKKTVDILFDAYFNDTLRHENCYACACGNLIAAANGYTFIPTVDVPEFMPEKKIVWDVTGGEYGDSAYRKHAHWYGLIKDIFHAKREIAEFEILSTGYTIPEFKRIENDFEKASQGDNNEDWIFNGLCAVLETLKEIHQVNSNEEEVKRFTHHYHQKSKCTHP